ncbi:MAG TPA: NUDIX hydrolase [Dermatophilaceae bacterium]
MKAEFCACCGGRLTTVVVSDRERPVCSACGHIVYSNPAPVAMVLARDADRRLLLVKRGVEPLKGFWALPSGYVETDESVAAAAVREVLEETGLEVAIDGLEGVYSAAGLGVVLVVYQARIVGGLLAPGSDADDVRLADPREVPAIRVPPGGTKLDHWFADLLDQLFSNARDPYPAAASGPPAELVTQIDPCRVGV